MSRRVLILTHPTRVEAGQMADHVAVELLKRGLEPVTEIDDGEFELAMVLGGDGSILHAAETTLERGIPIVGVNMGHVGFLAEGEVEHISDVVRRAAERDYEVEERMTLEVTVEHPESGRVERGWALNEATVEKVERSRMIDVAIGIDGLGVSSFGCDAVVMSTPTGSTAYAFSGGGPVVWPDVEALLLVPISAHALFARPMVVGPDSVLAVEILHRSSAAGEVWCDGRRVLDAPLGSHIEVRKGTKPVRLARLNPGPFTDRLVRKFNLPVTGWRGGPEKR
ncbi:MAG TPA: NAD kinase [Beutenbergiaceae bacterium]|nr:NAD kinase [Beutenbergiaceae bacterium]